MQTSSGVASLGVAVIGLGVGEQHALAYARSGCPVRWVYDLEPSRMMDVTARLGHGAAASSFQAILEDPSIDIVSIASFDDAHFEQVVGCLAAGKHVFVEKPLCRSEAELRAIADAWRRSGRRLRSNLVLRAAPLYRWVREQIESGAFGDIYAFDGDYLYGRIHKITEGWRRDVENYSVVQGGGVHLVDLMMWLSGQRPAAVSASGNRISTEGTAFRYKDFAAATFTFPSGLVGRITANFGSVHRHQHVVRIFGTRATFIYDDAGARVHLSRDPASLPERPPLSPIPTTKGDLIPDFIAAVAAGAPLRPDTQHEFDVISACVAADRALATGAEIKVDYV